MKEKLLKIIEHYGFDNQRKKLNEEVFELTDALSIDLRVAEELADVLVILEQIKLCYEITDEEVQKIMEEKVDRQLSRIREEKKIELPEKLEQIVTKYGKLHDFENVKEELSNLAVAIDNLILNQNATLDYLKYKEEESKK